MAASLGTDIKTLYGLLSPLRRRQLVLVMLLMPITAIAEMAMVAAIVPFLSQLAGSGAQTTLPIVSPLLEQLEGWTPANPLLAAGALFAFTALATAALRLALSWTSQQFAFGMGHELAVEIQRRLLHQPYLFHLRQHSSELLAALDKVDHLIYNLLLQLIQAVSATLIALFVIAVLVRLDPLSAVLAALLVGGLYGLTLLAARRKLSANAQVIAFAFQQRLKSAQESLSGIRDIILDRSQTIHLDRFTAIDRQFMQARAGTTFLASVPRILVEALGLILIALLAVVIAGRPGGFVAALPILGALALGAQRLLPLMNQLYTGWANLAVSRPIIGQVATLASLPMAEATNGLIDPLPFTRSIRLENISFRYTDRSHQVLSRVSLSIPKGSRVAITGKTGSGKSTLSDLLMGLIQPDEGHILVDGTEIGGRLLEGWRQCVSHVPQSIALADASIADNIALGLPYVPLGMDRVREAADKAQLASFVASLPDGFDTMVGERGVRLSGGQRQRLALARAIYKRAPLLVLDEATSALDDETEAAVLAALDELSAEGCTIVIVAHRMSTVAKCDRIFVLEDGALVRTGSFAELYGPLRRLHEHGDL